MFDLFLNVLNAVHVKLLCVYLCVYSCVVHVKIALWWQTRVHVFTCYKLYLWLFQRRNAKNILKSV